MKKVGSKAKIKMFLIANVGNIVSSAEIQEAAGGVARACLTAGVWRTKTGKPSTAGRRPPVWRR